MDQIEAPWSPQEDEMLQNIVGEHGPINWSLISKSIPGRSDQSCWSRWFSLKKEEMDQIEGPWGPEEDEMLDYLVGKYGQINWSLISQYIPDRSGESCESRWLSLQRSFTLEEDEMLQNLVEKHGHNWSLICKSIQDRSAKTCKSRWIFIQRSFTPEEDEMLQNLFEEHGPNWSLISKSIPDRSGKSCSSWWSSLQRSFTREEDKMLQNLVETHGRNWSLISKSIPGKSCTSCRVRWLSSPQVMPFTPEEDHAILLAYASLQRSFTPEEDRMLQNLIEIHGGNWSLISKSIGKSRTSCRARWLTFPQVMPFTPEEDHAILLDYACYGKKWDDIVESLGRPYDVIENHWISTLRWKSSSMTNDQDIPTGAHKELLDREHKTKNYLVAFEAARGQAPSIGDITMDNVSQPSRDSSRIMIDSDNMREIEEEWLMPMEGEFVSQNFIQKRNSSHEVAGMVSGQASSISDMARGNMSSGSRHSYSRDHSAPSWNALYKRDSSPMMIDNDNMRKIKEWLMLVEDLIGSQNFIHKRNSSHEVGGMVSGQAPSISDMARGNMSSGGTHSYSRDHSAPSWNALYKRDSSLMND